MSYTAMYRKFRPQRFEDVKGQDHIVTTLVNQIRSDRIGHAYLFCGTRGTGKTSVAKLFAKAINCQSREGADPCMECASCKAIQSGASMNVVEIDAASNNGVDNIRTIVEEVQYPPVDARYKVYIIDEVHMLSIGAFNALLKTLEEPPSYVVFILATTEVYRLPVTILSRCQRYDFRRISVDDISARMKELMAIEGIEAEEDAIRYIARSADGALRDALSLLDQCIAFNYGKRLTHDMVLDVLGAADNSLYSNICDAIIARDVSCVITALNDAVMSGREISRIVGDLTAYLRNLLLLKTADDTSIVTDMSAEDFERLSEKTRLVSAATVLRYVRVLSELGNQIRYAGNKRILTEIALIKLCCPEMEATEDSVLPRVRKLEERLEKGVFTEADQAPLPQDEINRDEKPVQVISPAAPEDVRKVAQDFKRVLDMLSPGDKPYAKGAVASVLPDGSLELAFTDKVKYDHFNRREDEPSLRAFEELKAAIDTKAERDVTVVLKFNGESVRLRGTGEKLPELDKAGIDFRIEEVENIEEADSVVSSDHPEAESAVRDKEGQAGSVHGSQEPADEDDEDDDEEQYDRYDEDHYGDDNSDNND